MKNQNNRILGIILSAFLLILGLVLDATHVSWFANTYVRYLWYIVASFQ